MAHTSVLDGSRCLASFSSAEPSRRQGTHACEQFFIEGIEQWRRSVGLNRVVLLGHSFGGYFAACYAARITRLAKGGVTLWVVL